MSTSYSNNNKINSRQNKHNNKKLTVAKTNIHLYMYPYTQLISSDL